MVHANTPQVLNNYDSGVFVLTVAELSIHDLPLAFCTSDVDHLRLCTVNTLLSYADK